MPYRKPDLSGAEAEVRRIHRWLSALISAFLVLSGIVAFMGVAASTEFAQISNAITAATQHAARDAAVQNQQRDVLRGMQYTTKRLEAKIDEAAERVKACHCAEAVRARPLPGRRPRELRPD